MFVHLHVHSPFSFLDGAATIESLIARAAAYGMSAMALTDHNSIAGLPSFHKWAAIYGMKPISGAELTLDDGSHVTVIAETQQGYENLCRLLTIAHDHKERRQPMVPEAQLLLHAKGLILLSGCRHGRIAQYLLGQHDEFAIVLAQKYKEAFPDSFFIELQADSYPQSRRLNAQLAQVAEIVQLPMVATSNVHYAIPDEFPIHDILSCMRLKCDIQTPHAGRPLNRSRWLHSAEEAKQRFSEYPSAIENTIRIAERCQVVLKLNQALFPAFALPTEIKDNRLYLRELVYQGAKERYLQLGDALRHRLDHELAIIEQLGYVDYFLVVWDIVHYARRKRIRCAGRGSAADSAVAYCLYITDVDAAGRGLLFERFMSLERAEKPDIDIDFESTRRDEVMDYVYQKYGRDHVARVATYQTFRGRSAIRDIGAALCIPGDVLDKIAKRVPWMAHADQLEALFERVPEMQDLAQYREQLRWLWVLAAHLAGFPRHFGMHVGGIIISRQPLLQTTSLQPSAKGEWITPFDKDAVEEVGLVKLDLLSLRTMSAIEGTVRMREQMGTTLDYDNIPFEDKATYNMLGTGNTVGVFQLESPAQRALQARLHPERLEDIVASVALIRPGPIKGNMVDPFLARRRGQESISYLHPKLEPILSKTYGVVLFQEQVIEIATEIAEFTPGEADRLRRVMSKARSAKEMEDIGREFMAKASMAGVDSDVAKTIFSYIKGYASYGFCEAHAAAFAATAYKTAYLVQHYPAEFYASILNQYPMGYYPVHVICAEARRRGIQIFGVDVNRSMWDCVVESVGGRFTIWLGLRLLKGFRQHVADEMVHERSAHGAFRSLVDLLSRVPSLDRLSAERLIRVGGLDNVQPGQRRTLLWQLPSALALRDESSQVLFHNQMIDDNLGAFANNIEMSLAAKLADEYNLLGVGVSGHWLDLVRPRLTHDGYITIQQTMAVADNIVIYIAGLVIRPHRPPTKSGKTVVFFSLEDETGTVDVTMFESVYRESGAVIFTPYGRLVGVQGTTQRRDGERLQVIVSKVWSLIT